MPHIGQNLYFNDTTNSPQGAQGWEDIENYGISKQQWLEEFLALPHGIPSDDTFRRVFEFINPEALNRCFLSWVETLLTKIGGEIIPIDGKTIRGSYNRFSLPSVWGTGKRAAADGSKFEIYENNLHSEYHIRYGGYGGIALMRVVLSIKAGKVMPSTLLRKLTLFYHSRQSIIRSDRKNTRQRVWLSLAHPHPQ